MKKFVQQHPLPSLLFAFFGIGLIYIFSTPPLESSDEYKHYPVVQYIQTQGKLPVLDPEEPGLWLQEGAQPPLYYQIMAAATFWIDTSDLEQLHQINKHAFIGDPNQIRNKNIIIHNQEAERFPWHGTILAIYIIRLASLAISGVTLLVTAKLGKRLFNSHVGLLAASLTAFNPMFLFVSTAVNNDVLANLLGAVALYLLIDLWQTTPDPQKKWRIYLQLGFVLGLGLLAKLSLGGLLGLTGLALAWQAWRQKRWQLFFIGGPIVLSTALATSAYWFIRNIRLYGDLTGLNVFVAVQGTRDNPIGWIDWVQEFGTFYRSYWGLFGGVNILSPNWLYVAFNLLFTAGFVGFLIQFIKNRKPFSQKGIGLIIGWTAVLFLLLIRWNIISPAFQGRLLFPALSGINVLWAVGLLGLLQQIGWKRKNQQTVALLAIVTSLIAIYVGLFFIRPAYAHPEPATAVPPTAIYQDPITFSWGDDSIQLIGAEVAPEQSILPADQPVKVTLYWQAVTDIQNNYLSTIHLLGRDWESSGFVNRYPAWGVIPTSQWQAGQIWQDEYQVYANKNAIAPTRLRIKVSLYNPEADTDLPAMINDTLIDPVLVGEARLAAKQPAETVDLNSSPVQFEDGIDLIGYAIRPSTINPGDDVTVELFWTVRKRPLRSYTIFIHLRDLENNQLAGADAPPLNNDYPTNLWHPDDLIIDPHTLHIPENLPPGSYQLFIGLYNPETAVRLQQLLGDNEIAIPIEILD